jgi:hypothetical protein
MGYPENTHNSCQQMGSRSDRGVVATSRMSQEPKVNQCEHHDDRDIADEPFPDLMPEEQEIDGNDRDDHQRDEQHM